MPQFKFFRNTTGVSQCNARVLMLQLLSLRNNSQSCDKNNSISVNNWKISKLKK
jgi:hypothetical protein